MKNNRKILITGADGFVGSYLSQKIQKDYNIIKLIAPGLPEIPEKDIFSVDLADKNAVLKFAESQSAENYYAVIHCAFILCQPNDDDNFLYLHKNNQITENIIELFKNIYSSNFINFSSLAVYPNKTGVYYEDSIVDPSNNTECLYGLAKFNSEIIFSRFLADNINVINLRMCQVYGSGMQEDRVIGMFRKELKERKTITVFGNGERISNFIHIDDVIESVMKILENPRSGTYNLGCCENISYRELAENLLDGLGESNSKIVFLEKGVKAKVRVNTEKFEQTFDHINSRQDFCYQDYPS